MTGNRKVRNGVAKLMNEISSSLTIFNFCVWMLQFGAHVVDAEMPVDPGLFAIALLGPGRRFRRDQCPALDPAI